MKSLVIGMGFGHLYKKVLTDLGYQVITVDSDPNKHADYPTVIAALFEHTDFDTVNICTPNYTHMELAGLVAPHSKIVFVEKPGVQTADQWQELVRTFPKTRFVMVKNNQWRSNIAELQQLAATATTVHIEWSRRNCIPSPGSWFTTKELAFGGVSRDLMPHLLSLYIMMNPTWDKDTVSEESAEQIWQLAEIEDTEYGTVNPRGTYDVDDVCEISFGNKWQLTANWRNLSHDNSAIEFCMQDNTIKRRDLGWCPEAAYRAMILSAVENLDNTNYWQQQLDMDLWIHQRVESL